jgi:hypothetical protein
MKALIYRYQLDLLMNATVNLMRSLLHFDPVETASKIRSRSDAQDLVDLIFYVGDQICMRSEH